MLVCLVLLTLLNVGCGYLYSGTTTVSGLSAGAYFAVQYHVAYSNSVNGSAIFAGGPYFCALANLEIALSACMTDPSLIDMDALVESARVYASNGDIDELDGLRGDQVFVYSGMKDTVVHTGVVKKTEEFYKAMKTNVSAEYSISSEHCQPTTNFGNNCSVLGEPFINICAYDGAGIALSHLVGKMNPRGVYNPANLITIEQNKYYPVGWPLVPGLALKSFVYVPTSCQNNASCSIHASFHGCNQGYESVGLQYVEHSGYLEWAETNNMIVLFPQAVKSDIPYNPQGCFDWWGYSDPLTYAIREGLQMATVRNMIEAAKSSSFFF